jgi:type I restriction-modification system DNA methylase subunit
MSAPESILELIERFERNIEDYRSPNYNEARLRLEFIDPFFEALGWDVQNKQGNAEAYKDVITEDSLLVEASPKAPDYCFRFGGQRKFFVEAKKPAVNIKEDSSPAFQLRRYAWSAKLPLSILTDFEEFAVYDTRIKPEKDDKASTARVEFIKYTEYAERWDEIADIFSPDAIRKGSFDRFVVSTKKKRGTAEVDDAFLEEIESWRDMLARNIALRNPGLSQRELNFAVQATIDRIIFLRICEGRGIEEYGTLMTLQNGVGVYPRLMELFKKADFRYNSGLFHFDRERGRPDPDTITPKLTVDDKVLKDILKRLYYPESPYEFSMIPPDILGQVYERFLGKVIRLTPGGQAKVEDKPEVRKAGGVYYTPTYIVDYIVKHTVGKLLDGKNPKKADKIRILDPACGSGSFLLGAYQYLLDWYLDAHANNDPESLSKKRKPPIYRNSHGEWRLSPTERKRILLHHIYGVDIDSQAVEVTKLSLVLKVLEGENEEILNNALRLFHERALPDLDGNIKCGNSLIGPDFYDNLQMKLLDEEEQYRINVFDWKKEFAEVFKGKNPGFDAVIGNPPYGCYLSADEVIFLGTRFPIFRSIQDGYVAFMEQAHKLLNASGFFGFIIPSAWLGGPGYGVLRQFLLGQTINSLVLLPFDVFRAAYIDTVLVVTQHRKPTPGHAVLTYEYPKREKIVKIDIAALITNHVKQSEWAELQDVKFVLNTGMAALLGRIRTVVDASLNDIAEMKRGVLFDQDLLTDASTSENSYPYFEGDVYRYLVRFHAPQWVEFGSKMREWPKEIRWFQGERIVLRRLVNRQQRLMASLLTKTVITNKNLYTLFPKGSESLKYILGHLNSRLYSRLYLSQVSQATKDDFPQVTIKDVLSLPIRPIDFSNPSDRKRHDRMVDLVDHMLDLHKKLPTVKTPHEKDSLQRQIDAKDSQIDRLVYELYELTDEEIRIVEGENK